MLPLVAGQGAKTERPTKLVAEEKGRQDRASLPSLSTSTEPTPCSYSQRHLYSSIREPRPRAQPALQHPRVRDHTPVDESATPLQPHGAQPQQSPRVLPSSRLGPSSRVAEPLSLRRWMNGVLLEVSVRAPRATEAEFAHGEEVTVRGAAADEGPLGAGVG